MNENFNTWIETLRTTDLPQGQKMLRTSEGEFCCLGIACTIAPDGNRWLDGELLPVPVAEWLGLRHLWHSEDYTWEMLRDDYSQFDLVVDYPLDVYPVGDRARNMAHTVASYNDAGFTFPQIADMIEYFGISSLQC